MSEKLKKISDDALIAAHAALVAQVEDTINARIRAQFLKDQETVNICNALLDRCSKFLGEIRDALGYDPTESWRPTIINGEWVNPSA